MRVLLIEDDSAVAQSIELMLKSESFNVYTTDLGEEGVDLGKLYDYDIILLDLNLPDMSGYDVLKQLRVSKIKTPILILSGLAGIEDKVKGLGFGADDYMTKPFHKDELIARIHAIVRRWSRTGCCCWARPSPWSASPMRSGPIRSGAACISPTPCARCAPRPARCRSA
jgi:two-component system, cell cycle response regulator CtrA